MKTGIELSLTLQLALELMDEMRLKGKTKNLANLLKNDIEKDVIYNYNVMYKNDPQMVTNLMNSRHRLISQIAEFDEPDLLLLSHVINHVVDNIDKARENRVLFLNELL
jgi:hypothetical protein